MGTTRKPDQTVREYVSNFDSSYSLPKSKANMAELPPVFLMWGLIENADISEHKKLVLSGVNLDKSDEIYEAIKKSLLKYCGNDSSPSCSAGAAVGPFLAPESTFFTRGRGFNNFRGKGYPNRDLPKSDGSHLKLDGKKINPKKDGLVVLCDFCGSSLHLWKECRDRKEQNETKKFETYANT